VLDLLLEPGCTWAGELLPAVGVLVIAVIDMVSLLRPCDGDELLGFRLLLRIAAVTGMGLFATVGNRVLPDICFLELDFLEMLGELVTNEAEERDFDISRML
jgi:hypothetical protein